jgi:hypothetical protein
VVDRQLNVDRQDFIVTPRHGEPGVYDFTWVSGTHDPHHGFSLARSDGSTMSEAAMRAAIADFLSNINPETGYLD